MNIKYSLKISRRSEQIGLDHDEETDYRLLTRIAAQDRRALRKLFSRHQARVHSVLCRIRHSREPVEETVIETFAVVWRKAHTFPCGSAPSSSLYMGLDSPVMRVPLYCNVQRTPSKLDCCKRGEICIPISLQERGLRGDFGQAGGASQNVKRTVKCSGDAGSRT
jgi:hypothetical protein